MRLRPWPSKTLGIVAVRGRAADQVNRGQLGPKGLFGWQANNSPDQLHKPLVRQRDELVETDWDPALGNDREGCVSCSTAGSADGHVRHQRAKLFLEDYYALGVLAHGGVGTLRVDGNTWLCTATVAAGSASSGLRWIPHGGRVWGMTTNEPAKPGYSSTKDDQLKRLRRVEGQVRGIAKMVEDDKYCIDVLTQLSAATKALQAVALGLLDEHMAHCVVNAARAGGAEQEAKLKEASEAIARLVRS
jgi:DNA-binding FrmR family transcriptional regulator